MFWLSSIAIFKEDQYLKTRTALLYSLSIVNGKIHNVNMLLNLFYPNILKQWNVFQFNQVLILYAEILCIHHEQSFFLSKECSWCLDEADFKNCFVIQQF